MGSVGKAHLSCPQSLTSGEENIMPQLEAHPCATAWGSKETLGPLGEDPTSATTQTPSSVS